MRDLEGDLLWQARNLDLAGNYREAEQLRKDWCKQNEFVCDRCRSKCYPGWHDQQECDLMMVAFIHDC